MESDWIFNVTKYGIDGVYLPGLNPRILYYRRVAELRTPIVVGGFPYNLVLQTPSANPNYDYIAFANLHVRGGLLYQASHYHPAGPFPWGYDVLPDHP